MANFWWNTILCFPFTTKTPRRKISGMWGMNTVVMHVGTETSCLVARNPNFDGNAQKIYATSAIALTVGDTGPFTVDFPNASQIVLGQTVKSAAFTFTGTTSEAYV